MTKEDKFISWLCGEDVEFPFGFEEVEVRIEN